MLRLARQRILTPDPRCSCSTCAAACHPGPSDPWVSRAWRAVCSGSGGSNGGSNGGARRDRMCAADPTSPSGRAIWAEVSSIFEGPQLHNCNNGLHGELNLKRRHGAVEPEHSERVHDTHTEREREREPLGGRQGDGRMSGGWRDVATRRAARSRVAHPDTNEWAAPRRTERPAALRWAGPARPGRARARPPTTEPGGALVI